MHSKILKSYPLAILTGVARGIATGQNQSIDTVFQICKGILKPSRQS